ncbi:MAG TPA: ester cyclase [Ktedonobacteraceae bacterium]|jgi:predicted ester cyclase|nr:ester cyclase [Ktedonobacteraceae bacterium]
MSIEVNKALVKRYIEMWRTGDISIADEILDATYVDHAHSEQEPGPEAVKQEVLAFHSGFSHVQASIEQMIGEGDLVAFRFTLRGTHTGHFAALSPTHKETTLTGADFIRIQDGKMVELWSLQDTLNWVQQFGFKIFPANDPLI